MPSSTYLIIILFLSSQLSKTLSSHACISSDTIKRLNRFTSCLTQARVTNFTTFPQNHNSSASYYTFFNYSLNNLRFTDPSLSKPLSIVLPSSVDQVSNTVVCARDESLAMRVRSGGHSYEGASSVSKLSSPFIIIDLMNLDKVTVDLKSKTAWVEGGATLGQLYKAIADASEVHAFSAGSCPTVGVGGHISGGGYGLLSRKYGLAADNVDDVILIDGYARKLNRSTLSEDVFWALRGGGGGSGWGIIAAWKIKLQEVPKTVTSCVVVTRQDTKDNLTNLIDTWQSIAPNLPDELYISAFVGSGLPGCKPGLCLTFKAFYLGPIEDALLSITRIPGFDITRPDCIQTNWIESVLFFSGLDNKSTVSDLSNRYSKDKHYFKAKSDYVKSPIPPQGLRTMLSSLELESKGYVILDPYGGAMSRIPYDHIAFPHRAGNLFSIQYLVEWNADEDRKRDTYLEWIRMFYSVMERFVSKSPRAAYVNYLDYDLGVMEGMDDVEMVRVWGEKYFLKNFDRLVIAKTEIDPENFFWSEQSIPPLLLSSSM